MDSHRLNTAGIIKMSGVFGGGGLAPAPLKVKNVLIFNVKICSILNTLEVENVQLKCTPCPALAPCTFQISKYATV